MKFPQRWVLLLGGLLSASSMGCSAVTALAGDTRPASRPAKNVSDRMVAVAQVFEGQGRFDEAEVLYRKALKQNPRDAVVRQQLQQLAARKNEAKSPGGGIIAAGTPTAIVRSGGTPRAQESIVNVPATAPVTAQERQSVISVEPTMAGGITPAPELASAELGAVSPVTHTTSSKRANRRAVKHASVTEPQVTEPQVTEPQVTEPQVTEPQATEPQATDGRISAGQVMEVADSAHENSRFLLQALRNGDSLETQCLAATLLGDCAVEDALVRDSLVAALNSATHPRLRAALCDSRIQRAEIDEQTFQCLTVLTKNNSTEYCVPACSSLRSFAGTQLDADCVHTLTGLLESPIPELRSSAATTLANFSSIPEPTIHKLNLLATEDGSVEVREAAKITAARNVIK